MQTKNPVPQVSLNIVDKFLNYVNPARAVQRVRARATMQYFQQSGFITPGSPKRTMRGWFASSGSADSDSIPKLDALRQGSRDLVMNSPLASAPLNREVTNAVGWGLTMQSRIDRELLGLSEEEAADWERNTEREFRLWSMSKDSDAARTLNFYEQQSLVMYNTSLSGDVFVLLPFVKRKLTPYSLAIQVLEADRVSNPIFKIETNRLAGGIEVDGFGAPITYYIRQPHNAFLDMGANATDTWIPIPAFGARSGRRNVLHLFHKKRPGQRRGIPMLAPVIETLKQLTRLTEAELAASVINSFFTVFIKTNPVTGGFNPGIVEDESVKDANPQPGDENVLEMASGNIIELPEEGQEPVMADPKRPNDAFEPFFLALIKQIGSALDIPFEQMILHFSASYSASRAALLEAWKFYMTRRMWLSRNFCQPVYVEWLTEAIMRSRVKAPGFFNDPLLRAAWCGTEWVGPGQGQIDPLKETKAAELRLKTYLSDYDTEFAKIHGSDWERSMDRRSREEKYLKDKDLAVTSETDANELGDQVQELQNTVEEGS